jgi:hypothetical protein
MLAQLPKPIATYLSSENAGDIETLAACFNADAVVRDERRTIEGLAAIRQWKITSREKYQHIVEPIEATGSGDTTIVTARVSGNFPGSPVTLRYSFGLKDGKIAALEIR